MRHMVPDYLQEMLEAHAGERGGELADYIPELAAADPDPFGVAIAMIDGQVHAAGDALAPFTIQSISKPFVYALALADAGFEEVLRRIDVEPSGNAFNELSLKPGSGRAYNPMINAGALTAHSLVSGADAQERSERIRELLGELAGRELEVDETVFASEFEVAHRNLGIAHMLRAAGTVEEDPESVVRGYTRQCSVLVTVQDLAMMAATLANGGVQPVSGRRLMEPAVVRQVLSVMMSCGMYDAAGDWITNVGIPAKSGVAGGLIGALPGQLGLAAFSPRLDEHGNTVRGVRIFERLSRDMSLHVMENAEPARSVMRAARLLRRPDGGREVVVELQGTIRFAGAERIVRACTADLPRGLVTLDCTRVFSIDRVARTMLYELARRLRLDGHEVRFLAAGAELFPDAPEGPEAPRIELREEPGEH